MWLKTTRYRDPEPAFGSWTEVELMEDDGEAREIMLEQIADTNEIVGLYYTQDDYTEGDIELDIDDYFDQEELTRMEIFLATNEDVTVQQLKEIL